MRVPAARAAGGATEARQPSLEKALRAPCPPRRRDAQEEGRLRRGGGDGGAHEEIGEVVS